MLRKAILSGLLCDTRPPTPRASLQAAHCVLMVHKEALSPSGNGLGLGVGSLGLITRTPERKLVQGFGR